MAGQERVFQEEEMKHLKVLGQEGAWYKIELTEDQHVECSKRDRTVEDKSRRQRGDQLSKALVILFINSFIQLILIDTAVPQIMSFC